MAEKTLYLIDGSSYFYRAFYAVRGLATAKGMPTNAIYGFVTMLAKLRKTFSPEHLIVVFDAKGPTFREKIYPEYKAHRPPMPEELAVQIPYIKRLPQAYRIASVEQSGVEADDIIGTLTKSLAGKGANFVIVGRDKDLMQVVSDNVRMFDDAKDRTIDAEGVREIMGVGPENIIDLLALMGDSSDNIPGVQGIGPKTAVELIDEFGGIEEIYKNLAKIPRETVRKRLEADRENAFLSKRLATIERAVPLNLGWDDLRVGDPDADLLRSMFTELEFRKLLADIGPSERPVEATPAPVVATAVIRNRADLEIAKEAVRKAKSMSIILEREEGSAVSSAVAGMAIAAGGGVWYIPIGHRYLGAGDQMPIDEVLDALREILEEKGVAKIGHDIKDLVIIAARHGVEIAGIVGDVDIASYLVDHTLDNRSPDRLAERFLQERAPSPDEAIGKGIESIAEAEIERVAPMAGTHAHLCGRLHNCLLRTLKDEALETLYRDVDLPLTEVLADMEQNGVRVDVKFLRSVSADFSRRLAEIQERIFDLAGERFNVESPKQLQRILFESLKLPAAKKTKTGYSTNIDVLEELAHRHPLPAEIVKFRGLVKLTNTYVDALPKMVSGETGRIHPIYHQTVTATGRLSCSHPNLQNIPVRAPEGRSIRKAFVPEKGKVLISADYSQIELRILAHMSKDERLVRAFREGEDVHAVTASEIFDVDRSAVNDDLRRRAKVINFGIIYGMGAHGLTGEIGADHATAQKYIDRYFERYAGVKAFFDGLLEEARKTGVVRTIMGRKRMMADLQSRNGQVRRAAERAAVNMPIQGTAADIMKIAMLNVHRRFRREGVKAKLILQVHDELVAETPEKERKKVMGILRDEMASAAALDVPLTVNCAVGTNWAEMEETE